MENMLEEDVTTNKSIGKYGAENILNKRKDSSDKAVILTHCNTVSFHFYFQKYKKIIFFKGFISYSWIWNWYYILYKKFYNFLKNIYNFY